jgi:hypothetical protein
MGHTSSPLATPHADALIDASPGLKSSSEANGIDRFVANVEQFMAIGAV